MSSSLAVANRFFSWSALTKAFNQSDAGKIFSDNSIDSISLLHVRKSGVLFFIR